MFGAPCNLSKCFKGYRELTSLFRGCKPLNNPCGCYRSLAKYKKIRKPLRIYHQQVVSEIQRDSEVTLRWYQSLARFRKITMILRDTTTSR